MEWIRNFSHLTAVRSSLASSLALNVTFLSRGQTIKAVCQHCRLEAFNKATVSPIKQVNMMTLAEHIIEATPERIKRENFSAADSVPLDTSGVSNTMNWLANYLGDVEQLPSIIHLR